MTDYQFYKRMGICPTCRKNKLYGEEGHCLECKIWFAEHSAKRREENKEQMNEQRKKSDRALRKTRKELGLCIRCGVDLKGWLYQKCVRCREKDKIYRRKTYLKRKERTAYETRKISILTHEAGS